MIRTLPTIPLLMHIRLSDNGRIFLGRLLDAIVGIDATTGRTVYRFRLPGVVSMDVSNDGATIVVLLDNGNVQLISVGGDGAAQRELGPAGEGVGRATVVRIVSQGYLVGGEDGAMDIIAGDGHVRPFARDVAATVANLAGEKGVIAASTRAAIHLFAVSPGSAAPVQALPAFPNPFAFPAGLVFMDLNRLLLWSQQGTGLLGILDRATMHFDALGGNLAAPVRAVSFAGDSIFALGANGDITLIDAGTMSVRGATNRRGAVSLAAVSPTAAVVGYEPRGHGLSSLEKVDVLTGETVAIPTRNVDTFGVILDPSRSIVYTLGIDASGATILAGHEGSGWERETALDKSDDELLGASLGMDRVLGELYVVMNGGVIEAWQPSGPVVNLHDPAFGTLGRGSTDGVVATLEKDSTILLWDSTTDRAMCELTLYPGGAWQAVLPDGSLIEPWMSHP